jgi:hypothetical protein
MRRNGVDLEGLEYGNAWELRPPDQPHSNWIVGDHPAIPTDSLRFVRHRSEAPGLETAALVQNLSLKWFEHQLGDCPEWGQAKPPSQGRTLSLLAGEGEFELRFRRGPRELLLVLDVPGDYVLWGEGLEHSWRPLRPSSLLTLRWLPADGAANPARP